MGWMMGWASAPYNPDWQRRYPHRSAWMALAGPAANLILMIISGAIIKIGFIYGWFQYTEYISFSEFFSAPQHLEALVPFLCITFSLNFLLFVFNLIPAPPLDGSTVIGLFFSEEKARTLFEVMHGSQFSFLGLLVAWVLFDDIFPPLYFHVVQNFF